MASHHVLLLGGSGKVAQLLTPMLLQRSWSVTSIIRNPDQVANLQKLGDGQPGKLSVLVRSLEDVKNEGEAKSIIDETFKIDRDAAIAFIRASIATPTITKFLMISFNMSRHHKPSWWTDTVWQSGVAKTQEVLKRYFEAKVAADEVLHVEARARRPHDFAAINLRPGLLTEEPVGRVALGKIAGWEGTASRASVAYLAALLLEREGVGSCWLDMLDGEEDPVEAVERCVREGIDCAEGESWY